MNDAAFEWDDTKAAANVVDHGISFESARAVFLDPFALDSLDERTDYGEDRYTIIGMAAGRLVFVAYTLRGSRIRLISARGAEPVERRLYHEDDAFGPGN